MLNNAFANDEHQKENAMRRISLLLTVAACVLGVVISIAQAQDDQPADVPFGQTITAELAAQLPITDDVRYEVGTADTADEIAALFDVDLSCLVDTNDLENPNVIQVGDELLIDADCPPYLGLNYVPFPRQDTRAAASDSSSSAPETYTVRVADTLDEIAFAFDVSLVSLIETNGIERPGEILPGQVLEIPADAPPYGRVPAEMGDTPNNEDGITYVVQPLDTLDVIGAFYDASVTCIAETNGIDNPLLLQPRTSLFIPNDCPAYTGVNLVSRGRIVTDDTDSTDSMTASEDMDTSEDMATDTDPSGKNIIETLETLTEAAESTPATAPVDPTAQPTARPTATPTVKPTTAPTTTATDADVTAEPADATDATDEPTESAASIEDMEAGVNDLLDSVDDLLGGDDAP